MPEPENFSPIEQFQDVNKRIWNRLVRQYLKSSSSDLDLDLTAPREALIKACLHKEDDSLVLTLGRLMLFIFGTTWLRDQYPVVAGELLSNVDDIVVYRPQVTLFFQEDDDNVEAGYSAHRMEVSWRLMDETHKTITEAKLKTIGTEIKTRFGTGSGYLFKKGRKIVRYRDRSKGYSFQINARTLADGKDLIKEVMAINGDTIESEHLSVSEVDDETNVFPYNPGTQTILGKRRNKPRRRPMTDVRFKHAYVTIYGFQKPVYLFSRAKWIPDALIEL